MNKFLFATYLFVLIAISSFATDNQIDSLLAVAQNSKPTESFEIYYNLAYNHFDSLELSIEMLRKAEESSVKQKNKEFLARAYYLRGYIYDFHSQSDQAIHYYNGSKEIYLALENYAMVQALTNNVGTIAYRKGMYDASEVLYKESLKFAKKTNDHKSIAKAHHTLALCQIEQSKLSDAVKNLLRERYIYEVENPSLADTTQISQIYLHIGRVLKDINLAQNKDLDTIYYYYKKSLHFNSSLVNQAMIFNNLGNLELQRNNYDSAEYFLKKSIDIKKNFESSRLFVRTYNNLGEVFYKKHEKDSALKYFQLAAHFNIKQNSVVQNMSDNDLKVYFQNNEQLHLTYTYLDTLTGGNQNLMAKETKVLYERYYDYMLHKRLFDSYIEQQILKETFAEIAEKEKNQRINAQLRFWLWVGAGSLIILIISFILIRKYLLAKTHKREVDQLKQETLNKYPDLRI